MNESIVTATPKHIESVRKKIEEIRKSISGRFFDLGELLSEIKEGGFHMTWGYANFGEWLEKSGLDMSERSAYYLIKIVAMGKELNIPREKLESVKISKLREIASLDPKKDGKKIRKLIDSCVPDKDGNEMSLEDVRQNVAKVRAGDDKIETFVFMTIKVTKTCKEEVIDPAIELVRAQHGDTVDSSGSPQEISPGRAIELILTDYLAGADEAPVAREEAPLPVEGQKALPPGLDEVTSQLEAAAEFEDFDTKPEVIPDAEIVEPTIAPRPQFPVGPVTIGRADLFHCGRSPTVAGRFHAWPPASPATRAGGQEVPIEATIKIVPNPDPTTTLRVADPVDDLLAIDEAAAQAEPIVVEAPAPVSAVDAAVVDCRAKIAATNAQIDGSQEKDDPLLDDAIKILKQNDGATPNALKLTFRIGELRAFKLYKQAKSRMK